MRSSAFVGVLLLVCQLGCLVDASRLLESSGMMRKSARYVVGYAICDSCWEMGVTSNSVVLPNVTAVIECMDDKGGISFRQTGTTDKTGAFLVQLPPQIADSISKLSTCRSRVIAGPSNHPCSVASIQGNPFLALQSLPDGREVYGVGPFIFRPRERFPFCKDSAASRQKRNNVGGGNGNGRKSQLSAAQLPSAPASPASTTMQSSSGNGNRIQVNLSLQISTSATSCNSNSSPSSNASPSSNVSASTTLASPNPFPSMFPRFPTPVFPLPSIPPIPPIPAIPSIPAIPLIPSMPSIPSVPGIPSIPSTPSVPAIPSIPSIPALPLSTSPTAPSPQPASLIAPRSSFSIPAPAPSPASAPR